MTTTVDNEACPRFLLPAAACRSPIRNSDTKLKCRLPTNYRSVPPRLGILSRRSLSGDVFGHRLDEFGEAHGHPPVSLHGAAVLERPGIVGVLGVLEKILEEINGQVEVVVVHVAAIEVQLAYEVGADPGPVGLDVVAQVIAVVA